MTREESEPSVGVFYFLGGKVYARSKRLSRLMSQSTDTGALVSFSTHFTLWGTLRTSHPDWTDKDDSFFPRGRVLHATDKDLFILRMDSCVPLWALPKILQAFHLSDLPPEKINIVHGRDPQTGDHHYQCFQCGPNTRRRVL